VLRSAQTLLSRVVLLSVTEQDDDEQRLRKAATVLLAVIVTVLAPIWSVTYLLIDRPISAAIPGSYSVISAGLLLWMTRRRRAVPGFPELQIFLFAALPVLLQASMGGFVHGSWWRSGRSRRRCSRWSSTGLAQRGGGSACFRPAS
jgi:guanylate cyclase